MSLLIIYDSFYILDQENALDLSYGFIYLDKSLPQPLLPYIFYSLGRKF